MRIARRSPHDREIVRLAVPAFGALVAEPLYLLADTAIVGHLGTNQLAGFAVAGTVLTAAFGIFNFLAYSTTACGRPPGRRREPQGRRASSGSTAAGSRSGSASCSPCSGWCSRPRSST